MRLSTLATWVALSLLLGCDGSDEASNDATADVVGDVAEPQCKADSDCPDLDACRPGSCDDGVCQNLPRTGSCDDQNACTENDSCVEGYCVGSPKSCDNQLWCDGTESCDPTSGECLVGVAPSEDDGVACTVESCDEENDTILHTPDNQGCADSNPCTLDYCDLAAGCLSLVQEGLACDDQNLCTTDDQCSAKGTCAGIEKVCDDGLFCNGSSQCNPADGLCLDDVTPPALDDGIGCTVDQCDEESRILVHTPDDSLCDDQNPCTEETCSPDAGGCITSYLNISCDDSNPCTSGDFCLKGVCTGTLDCSQESCFYSEQCGTPTGSSCAQATPLNLGVPVDVDLSFSQVVTIPESQNLMTPECASEATNGQERWFVLTLAQNAYLDIEAQGNFSNISLALYSAACDQPALVCTSAATSPALLQTLQYAGEYALVVDVLGDQDVTLTVTTTAP